MQVRYISAGHWCEFFDRDEMYRSRRWLVLNCLKCHRSCLARYTGENITVVYEMREDDTSAWQLAVTEIRFTRRFESPPPPSSRLREKAGASRRNFLPFSIFLRPFVYPSRKCRSYPETRSFLSPHRSRYMYPERLVHFCNCGVHGRESVLLA